MTKTIYLLITMYFYQNVTPPVFTNIFQTEGECEAVRAQEARRDYQAHNPYETKSVCIKVDRDFWTWGQ